MRAALIVLFVSGFTGLNLKCTTLPPKTEKAIETSESLDKDIDESEATPAEKTTMKRKNAEVRDIVKDQGETLAKQAAELKRLEWYQKTFWQIVLSFGGLAVGALGMWWLRR